MNAAERMKARGIATTLEAAARDLHVQSFNTCARPLATGNVIREHAAKLRAAALELRGVVTPKARPARKCAAPPARKSEVA